MFELQVVHIRNTVPLQDMTVLQIAAVTAPGSGLVSVETNHGEPVPFFSYDGTVAVVSPQNIDSLRLVYDHGALAIPASDSKLIPVLRLMVKSTLNVVEVRLNTQPVPFAVLTENLLVCRLPDSISSLDSVDVIVKTNSTSQTSFFVYEIPMRPAAATGASKAIGQLVKLMLTTPGSSAFRPEEGGGLAAMVGKNISVSDGNSSLAAQVTAGITKAIANVMIYHLSSKLPLSEKLLRVDLLGVSTDPNDPTSVTIALRAIMADKGGALINLMFGGQ